MVTDNVLTTFEIAGVEFFVRIGYEFTPPDKIKVTSLAIPMGDEGQMDLSLLLGSPELSQALAELVRDANSPDRPDEDPWRKAFEDARDGFI